MVAHRRRSTALARDDWYCKILNEHMSSKSRHITFNPVHKRFEFSPPRLPTTDPGKSRAPGVNEDNTWTAGSDVRTRVGSKPKALARARTYVLVLEGVVRHTLGTSVGSTRQLSTSTHRQRWMLGNALKATLLHVVRATVRVKEWHRPTCAKVKYMSRFNGLCQGVVVDEHVACLTSALHPSSTQTRLHRRRRCTYQYYGKMEIQWASNLLQRIIPADVLQSWSSSSQSPVSVGSGDTTGVGQVVIQVHPYTWQVMELLLNGGYRPVRGHVVVGVVAARLATAVDAVWVHPVKREWLLVEVKKYETDQYSRRLRQRHLRQLALTTVLFLASYLPTFRTIDALSDINLGTSVPFKSTST